MKSIVSRLHEIRCGNPATKQEVIQMAEDLINIKNTRSTVIAYLIMTSENRKYATHKHDVASWEKKRGSEVVELTVK